MANTNQAAFYHSPATPNLKIAMPSGQWVKFVNGNVCIAADDPLYSEKVNAIKNSPNYGIKEEGARVYKVDKAVQVATAEIATPDPLPTGGPKWYPTGLQKLYPEGKGTWFVCDKCGKKFATLLALEKHARLKHGDAYWECVEKQAHKPKLKSYGEAPAGRVIPPQQPVPPLTPGLDDDQYPPVLGPDDEPPADSIEPGPDDE